MKKLFLAFLLLFTSLFFSGCLETTEELTISADGTGTYQLRMDMSGLLEMMDMMKGFDTATVPQKVPERIDTVIAMRDFSDTASGLTAEEKALLRNAQLKMKMDEAAKEFKIDMHYPFTKISDVEKLMQLSQKNGSNGAMGRLLKNNELSSESGNEQMPDINSYYDMVITGNLIEKKLNPEKYKTLQQAEQLKNMDQGGDLLESIKFNTVIHLPRPAKKVTGSHAQLSTDKKTLTLKGTLQDLFQNPEAFSYRIEY